MEGVWSVCGWLLSRSAVEARRSKEEKSMAAKQATQGTHQESDAAQSLSSKTTNCNTKEDCSVKETGSWNKYWLMKERMVSEEKSMGTLHNTHIRPVYPLGQESALSWSVFINLPGARKHFNEAQVKQLCSDDTFKCKILRERKKQPLDYLP